ncbi:MAG: ABC transporter permease [Clostridia bacterium]|nr:ABC transporter permease [Clostridia bacterium]
MTGLYSLIRRNSKLFFRDKGVFFTSLITPMILLVLYATFLAKVYRDSFMSGIPAEFAVPDKIIDGIVGGQLVSSLLAVSCVTVAFCSNMIMVQDKQKGVRRDLMLSPVKPSTLALGYYVATELTTLLVCLVAFGAGLIYMAATGFYMSAADIALTLLDILLLTLFGTALSSVINHFLSTQGQISAVGSIVSSCYGFICGAYMPISQFGEGLRAVLGFLPGTYGTSLFRNHTMRGAMNELLELGVPREVIDSLRDVVDCNVYCLDKQVSEPVMFAVLAGSMVLLIAVYVLLVRFSKKK